MPSNDVKLYFQQSSSYSTAIPDLGEIAVLVGPTEADPFAVLAVAIGDGFTDVSNLVQVERRTLVTTDFFQRVVGNAVIGMAQLVVPEPITETPTAEDYNALRGTLAALLALFAN